MENKIYNFINTMSPYMTEEAISGHLHDAVLRAFDTFVSSVTNGGEYGVDLSDMNVDLDKKGHGAKYMNDAIDLYFDTILETHEVFWEDFKNYDKFIKDCKSGEVECQYYG